MTMNISYGRFAGKPVHPLLGAVIKGVNAKAPLLKFVATDADADSITWFNVFHDVEFLGKVYFARARTGKAIIVRSDNIKKQRGDRHAKTTTNTNVAVKTCLEVFKPKPQDKVAAGIVIGFNQAYSLLGTTIRGEVSSFLRHGSRSLSFGCFLAEFQGGALPDDIKDMIQTEKLPEKAARHRALESLRSGIDACRGVVLSAAPDNSFVAVDLSKPYATVVIRDTYALPTNYQEKLAILKIMEKEEPIANVGFKYNSLDTMEFGPSYFLADGDTVAGMRSM